MADVNLGTAYVTITASTKGMVKDINAALNGVASEGSKAGNDTGKRFGGGLASAASSGIEKLKSGLHALAPVGKAIGDGVVAGLKGAGVAIGAVASGIAALGKQSLELTAEYEQLAGGTQLLFGEAARSVIWASQEAYATLGMNQNEYLQQVNGFAIGLKTALGGDEQAAAQLAMRVVQAEADVAAATGVSSEAIQNAFNGIMKGNFTMLDNLQLGIVPTQEGFQAMIDSVNAWNEANGNATNYTIDNLADCQAALVDYVAMQGLAGHAGEGAASTISGSVGMMQAAWQNFLGTLSGSTDDIEGAIEGVVNSVSLVVENVMPAIEMFLDMIAYALPSMLEKILPVVQSVIMRIVELIPQLMPFMVDAINQAVTMIADVLPGIFPVVIDSLILILTNLIQVVCDMLPTLIPLLLDAAIQLFLALAQAVPMVLDALLGALDALLGGAISGVIGAIGDMLSAGLEFIGGLLDGVTQGAVNILSFFGELPGKILSALGDIGSMLLDAGASIMQGLLDGIMGGFSGIADFVGGIGGWIVEHKGPPSYDAKMLVENGMLIMQGLGTGLVSGFEREVVPAMDRINRGIADEFSGSSMTRGLQADVRYNAAGDWRNVMGERPVVILNDAVLNDDYEMRQSALSLLKDIRRAAVQ